MSETARKTRFGGVSRPARVTGDRALATRIRGGDPAAFDEMFRRYHQPIYRFCAAMVGPEEAEDMLQNAMTKAMTSLPDSEDFQMKPWLYRVARNECVDHLRRSARTSPGLDADGRSDDSGRGDPGRVVVERERLRWLVDDLNELPAKQRSALVMRELSGLSFAEIAAGVDTSEAGAKQLVYEARVSLEQADLGRRLDCGEVRESISSHDRRRLRARKVRSHMRTCRGCSDFERAISERRAGFQSLYPALPLGAAAGLLDAIHGGGFASGVAGAGSAATATGGALTGGIATGVIAKGAAVLVVAGGIGVGTAEVVRDQKDPKPSVERSATLSPGPLPAGNGAATEDGAVGTPVSARGPGAPRGAASQEAADRASRDQVAADRPATDRQQDQRGSAAERTTPGSGGGQGPDNLPEASAKGQARAQGASGAKPGQTGAAPPSRKPVTPPGQSSATGSHGNSNGSTTTNQGKSDSAPAVGRTESPGKSGK